VLKAMLESASKPMPSSKTHDSRGPFKGHINDLKQDQNKASHLFPQ